MGAKLQVGSVAGIPNTFDLIIGDAPPRPCRVIWIKQNRIGIAFDPPIAEADSGAPNRDLD